MITMVRKNRNTIEQLVERLKSQIRDAELTLGNIEALLPSKNLSLDSLPEWSKRRIEVWCKIYNEGGQVSTTRFNEICIEAGYCIDDGNGGLKTKGIGGLFSGGKYAHIQYGTNRESVFVTNFINGTIKAWTSFSLEEVAKLFISELEGDKS